MKYREFIIVFFFLVFYSCKTTSLNEKKFSEEDRYNMIIQDYCKRYKKDTTNYKMYYVEDKSVEEYGSYVYDILPMEEANYNYVIDINESISYLPSRYIEYNNEIFFIHEKEYVEPSKDLLQYLDSLHLLDSTRVKLQLGILKEEDAPVRIDRINDALESVDYIICKDKPYKVIKRIRGSVYYYPEDARFDICD